LLLPPRTALPPYPPSSRSFPLLFLSSSGAHRALHSFPTRRSSDLWRPHGRGRRPRIAPGRGRVRLARDAGHGPASYVWRSRWTGHVEPNGSCAGESVRWRVADVVSKVKAGDVSDHRHGRRADAGVLGRVRDIVQFGGNRMLAG